MSEVVEPVTPTIMPAKSEDKLEIEKEEIEKEEEERKEETKEESAQDNKGEAEEVKDDKSEESIEKKDDGDVEKTEEDIQEGEDSKKFKMPKIKTPKVIKELRSKSKERKKKKEEEKQNEEDKSDEDKDSKKEEDGNEKKEGEEAAESEDKKESEEVTGSEEKKKSEETKDDEEKKDETKDTKTKIKDAIDNIHMPKFHKPAFMKKKEEPEDKTEENVDGEKEVKEEKEKNTEEKEERGQTEESKDSADTKPEETKDTKSKVKEALDNIHMPKMPKLHKPNFMKKKSEDATTSEEKEFTPEEPEKEGEKGTDKEETEKADTEETKEDTQESTAKEGEEKNEKTEEEQTKPEKKSLMGIMTAKISKPAFLKKKKDPEEEKEGKQTGDEKPEAEENEKGEKSDKEDKDEKGGKDNEEKGDEKEKSDEKEEETKKEDEKEEESKKATIMDSLRSIKAPKLFSNKKEKITDDEADESKELLEKKDDDEELTEDGKDLVTVEKEKPETPSKASTLLQNIRSVASGVPALFKKGKDKEVDVEAGESQELLEKKDSTDAQDSNKIDEEELVEIKLDDGTEKKDPDSKSQDSEKKDPEKSEDEKDTLSRVKNAPSEACAWFESLEQQKKYGICGIIVGIILIILIIIIAVIATPGNWNNAARMVEGGKYIETPTSCGRIQGLVEGENKFSFTGIPYSVPVVGERRFTHSRLPETLDECPNGTFTAHAENTTNPPGSCWRMLPGGITGDEDCLTLDIFTPNVVYNEQLPVVVYVPGEGLDIEEEHKLRPTATLARQKMIVFVTVSIRTGVLGFLSHPALARDEYHRSSGNYGLGDLVTALKWINTNIKHFGGHKGKVTVMGHQFGATVVTALMGTPAADGLFNKVWVTSGASQFINRTVEDVQDDNNKILENLNCGEDKLKCLIDAKPKELLEAVPETWNTATKMGLPSNSEEPQHSWIAKDNFLFTQTPFLGEAKIDLPIVIGAPAQTDATADGYQYMPNWNDTDQYESMVESSLASFGDNTFPQTAMNQYNMSNNWKEYTSMVSDIRTICPLELLAHQADKNDKAGVYFYVAETPRSASQLGGVADSSADIAAIFGRFEPEVFHEEKFVGNMQLMFFNFVRRGTLPRDTRVGEGIHKVCHKINYSKGYDTCEFWKATEWNIVPAFAKI